MTFSDLHLCFPSEKLPPIWESTLNCKGPVHSEDELYICDSNLEEMPCMVHILITRKTDT